MTDDGKGLSDDFMDEVLSAAGPLFPEEDIPWVMERFHKCRQCEHATEEGHWCRLYKEACCFGKWRANALSECPIGKWTAHVRETV